MNNLKQTYTYVELPLSIMAFEEIKQKLLDADYGHCFINDGKKLKIDMNGIAVVLDNKNLC